MKYFGMTLLDDYDLQISLCNNCARAAAFYSRSEDEIQSRFAVLSSIRSLANFARDLLLFFSCRLSVV